MLHGEQRRGQHQHHDRPQPKAIDDGQRRRDQELRLHRSLEQQRHQPADGGQRGQQHRAQPVGSAVENGVSHRLVPRPPLDGADQHDAVVHDNPGQADKSDQRQEAQHLPVD